MTLTKILKRTINQKGFSLIEILMVLILIAVLAAIAINAFINFRQEARDAAVVANLKVLRTAIATQYGQMQLRCAVAPGTFPATASINANDITDGNSTCTGGMLPSVDQAKFVQGALPIPPTGTVNTVVDCEAGGDCTRNAGNHCDGGAGAMEQWCYRPSTGEIWLDSANSNAAGTSYELL